MSKYVKIVLISLFIMTGILGCFNKDSDVELESIKITGNTSCYVGETIYYEALVKYSDGSEKTDVKWEVIGNTNLAEISKEGKLIARNEGLIVIQATVEEKVQTISLEVIGISSIDIEPSKYSNQSETIILSAGEIINISTSLTYKDNKKSSENLTWNSSDANVIEVNQEEGTIKAIGTGIATVKISKSGLEKEIKFEVKEIKEILISGLSDILTNKTIKYKANVVYTDDSVSNNVNAEWSIETGTATIGATSGILMGNIVETVKIIATIGNKTGSLEVTFSNELFISKVELSPTTAELEIGEELSLTAEVIYNNDEIDNTNIKWENSNDEVVTLNNGVVTAIKEGIANITVSKGTLNATTTITVKALPVIVTSVEIISNVNTIKVDETLNLELKITYNNGNIETSGANWTSDDSSVASIDETGKIIGKSAGIAIITAEKGNEKDTYTIEIEKTEKTVETVSIENDDTEIKVGELLQLTAEAVYDDASTTSNVTWESSDELVASIDADGKVTALTEGTTTITAIKDEKEDTILITVEEKEVLTVTSINISGSSSAYIGEEIQLTATIKYSDDSSDELGLTWSSDKEGTATVDSDGLVTTIEEGTAVITAEKDGIEGTKSIEVKAKEEITSIIIHAEFTHIWAWVGSVNIFTEAWPGKEMTDEGDGWYYIEVKDQTEISLLFTNNEADQTDDIEKVTVGEWWYNKETKELVKEALTVDTKAPVLTYTPATPVTDEDKLELELIVKDNKDSDPKAYYTLDGTEPTTSSDEYDGSIIEITKNTTVKVITVDNLDNTSEVYTIECKVNEPIPVLVSSSKASGNFRVADETEGLTLTLTATGTNLDTATYSIDSGDEIEYTDGESITLGASASFGDVLSLVLKGTDTDGEEITETYEYIKQDNTNNYYSTNGTGFGTNKTMTIDGEISDWDESMKISQGIANDDPRIFNGAHEGPVFDLYALYSTWDDNNLYLMWQFTNVNDITNSDNGYPNSDNAKPWNSNMPQLFAFDIFSDKGSDGLLEGQELSVFKTPISFMNKEVDYMVAFNSKPSFLHGSAVYSLNDSGYFQPHETGKDWSVIVSESPYEQRFHDNLDIQFAFGDQFLGENIFGVNCKGGNYNGEHWGDTPEVLNDLDRYVDFLTLGHNIEMETFYEMKIPLNLLGIDKNYIETNGIGVMAISTFGTSATATLPHDPSVLDNAMVPYSEDDSTSAEKEDHDEITVPFARIGK